MAFPGILRRLFANNGAGPLLRADIIPAQNMAIDTLFIGAPIYQSTTTLPTNCMWADGSLALLADWPQFAAKYKAGGFAGMVLAANSTQAVKDANLGKFVLNANSTGLYMPRHGGQFMRGWTPGKGTAGAFTRDEMQEITGKIVEGMMNVRANGTFEQGALKYTRLTHSNVSDVIATSGNSGSIDFISSRVARTGAKTKPESIDQPFAIYMGVHA